MLERLPSELIGMLPVKWTRIKLGIFKAAGGVGVNEVERFDLVW